MPAFPPTSEDSVTASTAASTPSSPATTSRSEPDRDRTAALPLQDPPHRGTVELGAAGRRLRDRDGRDLLPALRPP